jgi:hypothetical protein
MCGQACSADPAGELKVIQSKWRERLPMDFGR